MKITHVLNVIVILYVPRHVVRVNKSRILSYLAHWAFRVNLILVLTLSHYRGPIYMGSNVIPWVLHVNSLGILKQPRAFPASEPIM